MELNNLQLHERIAELETENAKLKSYFLDRYHISNGLIQLHGHSNPQMIGVQAIVPHCTNEQATIDVVRAAITELSKMIDTMKSSPGSLHVPFHGCNVTVEKNAKTPLALAVSNEKPNTGPWFAS